MEEQITPGSDLPAGEQTNQNGDQDNSNPASAAESENLLFADLIDNQKIVAALMGLGITKPTPVQAQTIPLAAQGKDLVIQAKTGSGKTFAFVIPLILKLKKALVENRPKNTFGLIVTPTRELAQQVLEACKSLDSSLEPVLAIGGMPIKRQISELNSDPRIVVGTPGRILDLMRQKELSLKRCKFVALDEVDEMFSMGFYEDVRNILLRIGDSKQGIFASATVTPRVQALANSFLDKPTPIFITGGAEEHAPIEHFYCTVSGEIMAKPNAVCDLVETLQPRSAIVFCNTKSDTELVEVVLRRRGIDARRINSDLTQKQRTRIMDRIRNQDLRVLVATDIAARGIDIEQIDLVINYSVHEQAETYVHRSGRTGRAGRLGKAITLVGPLDMLNFRSISNKLGFSINELSLPSDEEISEARLALVYDIIKKEKISIQSRDLMLSKRFLAATGDITEPSDELVELIAKLTKYTITRHLDHDARSLDEELEEGGQPTHSEGHESGGDRQRRSDRDRQRGRNNRDRDQRRNRGGRGGRR